MQCKLHMRRKQFARQLATLFITLCDAFPRFRKRRCPMLNQGNPIGQRRQTTPAKRRVFECAVLVQTMELTHNVDGQSMLCTGTGAKHRSKICGQFPIALSLRAKRLMSPLQTLGRGSGVSSQLLQENLCCGGTMNWTHSWQWPVAPR